MPGEAYSGSLRVRGVELAGRAARGGGGQDLVGEIFHGESAHGKPATGNPAYGEPGLWESSLTGKPPSSLETIVPAALGPPARSLTE